MKAVFQNKIRNILSQVDSIKSANISVGLSNMKYINISNVNNSILQFAFFQEPRNLPLLDKYVLEDNTEFQVALIQGELKVADITFIEIEIYKMQREDWFNGSFEYTREEL